MAKSRNSFRENYIFIEIHFVKIVYLSKSIPLKSVSLQKKYMQWNRQL